MDTIKKWLFEKLVMNTLVKNLSEILDWALKHLGPNGGKTLLGLVAVALTITKALFPEQAAFIQPIYDSLGLANHEAVGAAMLYTLVGYAHKIVKGLRGFIEAAESVS